MIRIDNHAPSLNFDRITTTSTRPVVTAPTMLIAIERRQCFGASAPFRDSRSQRRTIPVCDSVKDVNTPTT